MKKITNEEYLSRLKKDNIEIIPVEMYKGRNIKILHRCICGKEWDVSPAEVYMGNKCGCGKKGSQKWKENEYLDELERKGIKVKPIEEYKDMSTKISHRCTCNNTWDISPHVVLRGIRCGCVKASKTSNSAEYLDKIKRKGIDIVPLEDYINATTKILHRCSCGNTWNVIPNHVLNGNKCGCRKFGQHRSADYYRGKPTILYYIKINNIYKIGLTVRRLNTVDEDIARRFGKDFHSIEILETKLFEDGYNAYIKEQSIIHMNRLNKYTGPDIIQGGSSKMFIKDIRYFRGSRKKDDICDFMGNTIKEGYRVLALNGAEHYITAISELKDDLVFCENNKSYLAYNIICIESIIKKSPEYFI